MIHSDNHAYDTHDSATMLLPWYINGSLGDEQRKMVDNHLSVCLSCRSELNTQHAIAQIVQSRDAASVGADIGLAQLRRRIQPAPRTLFSRVRDWSSSKLFPSAWIWASAVTVTALAFMALPLLDTPVDSAMVPGEFRTLSADDNYGKFHENSLRLVFSEGADAGIQQNILRRIHAIAVTEPSSRGVLSVQVPEGELLSALALLRAQKEVRLAEPVVRAVETAGSH